MKQLLREYLRSEDGATAIEYGLIVSMVGIGLITALQDLGQSLAGLFDDISRALYNINLRLR